MRHGGERRLGRRRAAGFTLIEVLVVIAIISILAGLSAYGVLRARKTGVETAAHAEIQMLSARIETFKTSAGFYPPSSLEALGVKGNGVNEGNESLFAFLTGRRYGGPFADDLGEDRWANLDGDSLSPKDAKVVAEKIDWVRGTTQLLEYVDLWGSPYVYIHSRDYGKKHKCSGPAGVTFEVQAQKNPVTGTYYAPTTFQLWSVGEDGTNQNGGGDDITSWR